MIEVETKTRDIPVWLTGLVLILCVAGGVWLVRWYTRGEATQTVEVPLDDAATVAATAKFRGSGAAGAPRTNRDPLAALMPAPTGDGVRTSGSRGNAWIVRAGDATMYVSLGKGNQLDLSPSYVTQKLTPEQAQVLMMRRRLLTDAAAREQVKLTAPQLEALRKVEDFRGMLVAAADKTKLTALFQAWRDATGDKAPQEQALVAALADVAKRSAEPTQTFDAARVEQVRKILTPEQVKIFNEGFAPPGTTPTPAPAPPAANPAPKGAARADVFDGDLAFT